PEGEVDEAFLGPNLPQRPEGRGVENLGGALPRQEREFPAFWPPDDLPHVFRNLVEGAKVFRISGRDGWRRFRQRGGRGHDSSGEGADQQNGESVHESLLVKVLALSLSPTLPARPEVGLPQHRPAEAQGS